MGKKKTTKKPLPEKAQAVETIHADPSASTAQTEPETPAVQISVVQTPAVQPSQAGTSQNQVQTPPIPLDAVMKLIQALSPGLNLEATLKSLATVNQITPIPQPPPQEQNPSLAEISSKQTTKPDEPKASESETSESTSQTSEKMKKTPTNTTPTPTTKTAKPTDSTTETIPQTGPIQVLGDVARLGDNPDAKAVEGEGRVEELVQATMRAGEAGAVGAEVEKEVDKEDEMARAEPEEIMGERIVESEIVVDGKTLKAEKGWQEAGEENERPRK